MPDPSVTFTVIKTAENAGNFRRGPQRLIWFNSGRIACKLNEYGRDVSANGIFESLNPWIFESLNLWILESLNPWILESLNPWILESLHWTEYYWTTIATIGHIRVKLLRHLITTYFLLQNLWIFESLNLWILEPTEGSSAKLILESLNLGILTLNRILLNHNSHNRTH